MISQAGTGAGGSTFTLALAGFALGTLATVAKALKNRFAVRSLHELDDRALKDIGLMRSDITAALDMPLHRDPSQHLIEVAGGGRTRSTFVATREIDRLRRHDADVRIGARMAPAA
jgi:uncharacterized protein YjiS (DUF1127 family)